MLHREICRLAEETDYELVFGLPVGTLRGVPKEQWPALLADVLAEQAEAWLDNPEMT